MSNISSEGPYPYSKGVERVVKAGAEQAIELGHSYIGSEHLLLGVLAVPWSCVPINELGLSLPRALWKTREILGTGDGKTEPVSLTFRARRIIDRGVDMARKRSAILDTADIVESISDEEEGISAAILGSARIHLSRLKGEEILNRIRDNERQAGLLEKADSMGQSLEEILKVEAINRSGKTDYLLEQIRLHTRGQNYSEEQLAVLYSGLEAVLLLARNPNFTVD